MTLRTIAVVGASIAGMAAAESLRHEGFDGRLSVIGDEPHVPYDRPPLSKQFLDGSWDQDRVVLASAKDQSLDLDWMLGNGAVGFDAATRLITLADGTTLDPDGVVIATGSRARTLPGTQDMLGVHVLRRLDDATALRSALTDSPRRVVVVGAGFIGAEVAATCRSLELDVTLIEPLDAPLVAAIGSLVGGVFADIHREHGVDLRLGIGVDRLEADAQGRVTRVHLTDGTALDADVVVVGVGAVPNVEWLTGSGLTIDNGIMCDATTHAAPDVVAAGDVARWPNAVFDDELMRVEHWDHAFDQGEHAARALLAGDAALGYEPVPWFWSDQYGLKLQMAGRVHADDTVEIVSGSLEDRRFVALYARGERLSGVLAMNHPRPVVQLRMQIANRISYADAAATFS